MNKKFSAFSIIEIGSVIVLICLVIAGSISSSRVVNFMSITNARETTSESALNLMKQDIILWLDSTSESSIDKRSSSEKTLVNNWYDSNSIESAPTSASQENQDLAPQFTTNSFNSLPALKFDGVDDSMKINNFYQKTLRDKRVFGNNFAIFLTLKPLPGSGGDGILLSSERSEIKNSDNVAAISLSLNQNKILLTEASNKKSSEALSFESNFAKPMAILVEYRAKEPRIFINNKITKIGQQSSFEKVLPPNFVGDLNQKNSFNGLVGEIIIINRSIDDAERAEVFGYLGKKWRLPVK
jgi:hypothetical protein